MKPNISLIYLIRDCGSGQILQPRQFYLSPGFAKIAPYPPRHRDHFAVKVPGFVSADGATNVYSLNRRAVMGKPKVQIDSIPTGDKRIDPCFQKAFIMTWKRSTFYRDLPSRKNFIILLPTAYWHICFCPTHTSWRTCKTKRANFLYTFILLLTL